MKPRARDLSIPLEGTPGRYNAITDVPGIQVGHTTLVSGEGRLVVGQGPVRTGVTAIRMESKGYEPLYAAWYSLNGCGEMTGTTWIEESGFLYGPILTTNTMSVGVVHHALGKWLFENYHIPASLPVVAETYDGFLNDINGFHVNEEHVYQALQSTQPGLVDEGCVGGGTGMVCHGFKGGIGTASRILELEHGGYTVGALVQANHGSRRQLRVAGAPVGMEISDLMPEYHHPDEFDLSSSIIVIIATDCPLLPHQLKRLARRVPLGIGRVGGMGEHFSGDIFLAFSTERVGDPDEDGVRQIASLRNEKMNPLFAAVVQATEESILNALVAAETMCGINGNTVYALPHDRLQAIMRRYVFFKDE